VCLDLDETLIHATRVACNNSGNKLLKYWGRQVVENRKDETERLLKQKPLSCPLNDVDYLKTTYGPQLFTNNLDIASPYLWSFPTDNFSKCWTLIRCCNTAHCVTSFYLIEYRPYCQNLINALSKLKKQHNVKIVISTLATRQYGLLVAEGLKLFKGYCETINGVSIPLIDQVIGLEDWRENCWKNHYPQHYGKKSLEYIELLFDVKSSQILCIDDKPEIWTNTKQVIYVMPYKSSKYFKQIHNLDDNDNEHKNDEYNDIHCSEKSRNIIKNCNTSENNNDNMKRTLNLSQMQKEEIKEEEKKHLSNNEKEAIKTQEQSKIDDVLLTISNYFEWYSEYLLKTPLMLRQLSWPQKPLQTSCPLLLSSCSLPAHYHNNPIENEQVNDHNYYNSIYNHNNPQNHLNIDVSITKKIIFT